MYMKKGEEKRGKKTKTKKKTTGGGWLAHVKKVRASKKGMSYKEALKEAAKTYKKK